jgi:methionyl aminopeptidase
MIILKTERDLDAMRPACVVATTVLDEVAGFIRPGLTTKQIDEFAGDVIRKHGAKSAFLGYRKYPCNVCISVNDEVVHGLAKDRRVEFGDIVSLDVGVRYNGLSATRQRQCRWAVAASWRSGCWTSRSRRFTKGSRRRFREIV